MNARIKTIVVTLALGCLSTLFANNVAANVKIHPVIDVYKTTQVTASQIDKKFYSQLQEMRDILRSPTSLSSSDNQMRVTVLNKNVAAGIKKMGHFAFVSVAPIMYGDSDNIYVTVDIVDPQDSKRLSLFSSPPIKSFADPDNLIHLWKEYQAVGFNLFFTDKVPPQSKSCPAYHCLFGFEHPALQKYQAIFENKVPKNKSKLISILRQDKDSEKRAIAAFLLAHIKNGEELINILVPAIYDPESGVRNNVMRVLGMTLSKMKNPTFPIENIIPALDFPEEVDRNKSLYVVEGLVAQPRYAKYIQQHASKLIMDNLKMLQPNLHDNAYSILCVMSGKKYGERDYQTWQQWLDTTKL